MRYHVLAADYDGTLATHGKVPPATIAAVRRLKASGRKFVLVTGRELKELIEIFPEHELCDRIVAENGALVYRPVTKEIRMLAEPPPAAFAEQLTRRIAGAVGISVGHVIVATWHPYEKAALELIQEMGLELQIIFNKGAVMILPSGVNKALGLTAALEELGISARSCVSVGDAENDHAFLAISECAVAVANALGPLKERADVVTGGSHSEGVTELIEQMIRDDLKALEPVLGRHEVQVGQRLDNGEAVKVAPYRSPILLAGSSGGGKSTLAMTLIEGLTAQGYQCCIIDPEGDFRDLPIMRALGDAQRPPPPAEVLALLERSNENLAVSLIGLPFADRAQYFETLLPHLFEMRARTGRPHWIFIDETHHVAPVRRQPSGLTLPPQPHNLVFITVRPSQVAPWLLSTVGTGFFLGSEARDALAELAHAKGVDVPAMKGALPETGQALTWSADQPQDPFLFQSRTPTSERRRHVRKYATGELEPERSFYFRGPAQKLNLRAHNLDLFIQMANGVDDETWQYHLEQGDYSRWFREGIKDPELADEAKQVEEHHTRNVSESRERIRNAIESRYTAAA